MVSEKNVTKKLELPKIIIIIIDKLVQLREQKKKKKYETSYLDQI